MKELVDTYQWPFFWHLKHSSSLDGPVLLLFPPGTTVIFQFSHYFPKFSSTWLFDYEIFSVDEGFAVHFLDCSLCCIVFFKVDEGVSVFQHNLLDVTEFWKFTLQIRFISLSTELGDIDLGEILSILVTLVVSLPASASALSPWPLSRRTLFASVSVPSRRLWHKILIIII